MEKYTITPLTVPQCILGECPVLSKDKSFLYWVDIIGQRIYCYNLITGGTKSWKTDELIGFIVLRDDGEIIGGLKSGLYFIDLLDGGVINFRPIDTFGFNDPDIRFNDGIQDANGGIWACTMDMSAKNNLGKYFYYDKNLSKNIVIEDYVVANGPALSNDLKKIFTVETTRIENRKRCGIYISDIIEVNNKKRAVKTRLFIDWKYPNTFPDGIITDSYDNIWVGEFNGNKIRCFSLGGELLQEISLPSYNVTKVALDEVKKVLYVTSGVFDVSDEILKEYPLTGMVMMVSLKNYPTY